MYPVFDRYAEISLSDTHWCFATSDHIATISLYIRVNRADQLLTTRSTIICSATRQVYTVKCIRTDRESIHASKEYLIGAGHRSAVLRPVLDSPWSQRQKRTVPLLSHNTRNTVKCIRTDRVSTNIKRIPD